MILFVVSDVFVVVVVFIVVVIFAFCLKVSFIAFTLNPYFICAVHVTAAAGMLPPASLWHATHTCRILWLQEFSINTKMLSRICFSDLCYRLATAPSRAR